MAITAKSSPLTTAANNIVKIGLRSRNSLPRAQSEFESFSKFLTKGRAEIEAIELPSQKKIKELANKNIVSNFGSAGNLLKNLLSGAFDLGNFISGFFPGKGEKIGKTPSKSKPQQKSRIQGNKLKLGGLRALGIVNTVFAGLDFATGLAEGESVGKAGAGAAGSLAGGLVGGALAGSLLSGAAGQALIPVPGLGFLIGAAVGGLGSFLGGYAADRVYEGITGEDVKKKQEEELKKSSQRLKSSSKLGEDTGGFDIVLVEFNKAVERFEDLAMNIGNFIIGGVDPNNPYNEPSVYPDIPNIPDGEGYDGPIDGDIFFPLPGGDIGSHGVVSPGQAFGAPRDGGARQHEGLDMTHHKGALDAPVAAYKTGKVVWANSHGSYDSGMMIDHGNGLKTRYFHITPLVKTGDTVYGGQTIARLFPAGSDTHLHFEVIRNGVPTNPINAGLKPGGYAKRIPAPLSREKAKEHHLRNTSSSELSPQMKAGVELYPTSNQQSTISSTPTTTPTPPPAPTATTPQPRSPTPTAATTTATQPRPITQPLPQNVMAAPPREQPKIQSYPSYSQGQSYILERQTIIATGTNSSGQRQAPVVVPVGGGGGSAPAMIINSGASLNSLMKNILLTSLSSS
jgi:murein DD-endopeptidase MepM/ murein hydrolase activator NlpD